MGDNRSDQPARDASLAPAPAAAEGVLAGPAPRPDWVPWLIALAVFAAYSVISVSYVVRLDPGSTDLAVFTEYVKQYAHLNAPVVDVRSPGFNLLGDHFHPIVALIAPFFLAAPTPVTLVVAQALLVAISVIPVSRAAAAKLGRTAARVVTAAYALSWGLQQMIDFDFHELAFAVPLLACSLSALVRGRTRAAVLWALPLVFVKEDQGFTVAAIGLIMLVTAWRARVRGARDSLASPPPDTGNVRAGLFLVVWGLAWSVLSIEVIIPFFNPAHQYDYWSAGGVLGDSSSNSVITLLNQIGHDYLRKLGTLALVLTPVAFLALRSPLSLAAVPVLLLRFINTNPNYWGPYYHYSAPLMPVVFIAAIDGLSRIAAARSAGPSPRRGMAALVRYSPALMLVIALGLCFWAPVRHLFQPQTYLVSQHVRTEKAAMAEVPDGATVEATQGMEAPLAARTDVFYARDPGNPAPEYIVLDPTDYYAQPPVGADIGEWVRRDHPDASYQQIFGRDGVYVFRRK